MSQVELHAVNHTAFPRYERAAKRALEVVLSPGDALYIPPYWLHQVTALSGPCSASVSVHTDSDSARIRDQMLSHQLPIRDEWAAPQRAAPLRFVRPLDRSGMSRERLLADARALALELAEGYVAPDPPALEATGSPGRHAMEAELVALEKRGVALAHDLTVGRQLAKILSGNRAAGSLLTEDELLELERASFLTLAGTAETVARIEHMLRTGRPLHN